VPVTEYVVEALLQGLDPRTEHGSTWSCYVVPGRGGAESLHGGDIRQGAGKLWGAVAWL
jgi:hypothetical protein